MTTPASVSVADLEYAFYKAASPAADYGLAVALGQGLVTISQQANLVAQSKTASGNQTAPTAGLAIATLAITTTGYFKVQVVVGFGATTETTAIDNFQLKNNGATVGTIPAQNTVNWTSQTFEFYLNCVSGQNLTINANAAASAGAIYKATIIITRQA